MGVIFRLSKRHKLRSFRNQERSNRSESWHEIEEDIERDLPDDKNEAIDLYFEAKQEGLYDIETYELKECDLEDNSGLLVYSLDMVQELDARGFKTDAQSVQKAHLDHENEIIFSDVISNFVEYEAE